MLRTIFRPFRRLARLGRMALFMNPFASQRSRFGSRRRGRGWADDGPFGLGLLSVAGQALEGLERRQLLAFTTDVSDPSIQAAETLCVSAFSPIVDTTSLVTAAAPAQVTTVGVDALDASVQATWQSAVSQVEGLLAGLPDRSDYPLIMNDVFGRAGTDVDNFIARREQLASTLKNSGLGITVELRPGSVLNGNRGAYAAVGETGAERIYINADWLAGASADDVAAVLLEEVGHAIDQRLNPGLDSAGDEGEWFSDVVRGLDLSNAELAAIEAEDDAGLLSINGTEVAVEFAITIPSSAYTEGGTATDLFNSNNSNDFNQNGTLVFTTTNVKAGDVLDFSGWAGSNIGARDLNTPVAANSATGFAGVTYQVAVSGGTATTTITFSGASRTVKQSIFNAVTFSSTSDDPARTTNPTISVSDNGVALAGASNTVVITGVNDAPVVAPSGSLAYTENGAAAAINSALTVTDVDSTNLTGATVSITAGFTAGDVLGFTTQNGITGSYNSATGVLTLSGSATVANYQAALRSVTYSSTSDNPTATSASRTVSWRVNDGSAANNLSSVATSTVTITAVNDAPVVTPSGSLAYTENGAAAAVNPAITVTDADSANLTGATVSITAGFTAGDVLGFTTQNGIAGSYNSATGVLTLSGTATVANYQAALRSVTY
ncbi:MAG: hypothetical protein ACKOYJ_12400, partial [Planctomycetia bacterium]